MSQNRYLYFSTFDVNAERLRVFYNTAKNKLIVIWAPYINFLEFIRRFRGVNIILQTLYLSCF